MLSSEANEISEKENKKTISVEHVEEALTELGFGDYIEGVRSVMGEWKEMAQKRTGRTEKMKTWGGLKGKDGKIVSEDELMKMQEALFGEAKTRMEGGSVSQGPGEGAS